MKIAENLPIKSLTTMRLGGPARFVLTVETPKDIAKAYAFASERSLPIWVMGGGANTIGQDSGFAGVIILNQIKGIEITKQTSDLTKIKAYGGEIWDDLVAFSTAKQLSGIEAMSAIPGTVGAAPVQNIGAYGQDVAQVLESVEVYDSKTQKTITLPASDLNLGYRQSIFNTGSAVGRYFIIAITIKLHKTELQPPFYTSLQSYIDSHHESDFSPANIRRIVSLVRDSKLPDPKYIASAGSFFKNINLTPAEIPAAEKKGIKVWQNPNGTNIVNSGWLIEQCNLKGQLFHGMRVSDKAALILINESAKTHADLAAARAQIQTIVKTKFGFDLEQEPVEIPTGKTDTDA